MKPKDLNKIINKLKKEFRVEKSVNDHYFYKRSFYSPR